MSESDCIQTVVRLQWDLESLDLNKPRLVSADIEALVGAGNYNRHIAAFNSLNYRNGIQTLMYHGSGTVTDSIISYFGSQRYAQVVKIKTRDASPFIESRMLCIAEWKRRIIRLIASALSAGKDGMGYSEMREHFRIDGADFPDRDAFNIAIKTMEHEGAIVPVPFCGMDFKWTLCPLGQLMAKSQGTP